LVFSCHYSIDSQLGSIVHPNCDFCNRVGGREKRSELL
jgi:hypothetical protein